MKKIISSPLMLIIIIPILTGVFFSGCNSDTASDGGITAEDVIGTWIKVWEGDPYLLPSGTDADTLIFDIGDTALEAVFYMNTEQVGGFRGTYSTAGAEITVSVTETWNEGWDFYGDTGDPVWNEESDEYVFPFTPGSSTLAITDFNEEIIEMEEIIFGRPEVLSDPPSGWEEEYDGHRLIFNAEELGSYSYDMNPGGDIDRIGTWDASGTESGYIRTVISEYYDGEGTFSELEWGFLNPYTVTSADENIYLNLGLYIDGEIMYSQFEYFIPPPED